MSKNLVLTGSVGDRPFTDVTFPNLEKYAQKCGADFIVEKDATIPENLKSIKLGRGDNKAYLNKVLWMRKHLENYDKVLWLDDTCIVNLKICPNLFDMVPQGYVAGVPESVERWSGYGKAFPSFMDKHFSGQKNAEDMSYNTGVFLIAKEVKWILSDEALSRPIIESGWRSQWPDQMAICMLLFFGKIPRVTLDSKFNRMRFWPKLSIDVKYEEVVGKNSDGELIMLQPFPKEDMDSISKEKLENNRYAYEAFIYHMTGRSNEKRIRLSKEIIEAIS